MNSSMFLQHPARLLSALLIIASLSAAASSASAWDVYTREECAEAIDKTSRAGVIHGLVREPTRRHGVMVVVDGTVWPNLPFNVKENIGNCINLIVMSDPSKHLRLISFLDHRSRRVIGKLELLRYSE